MLRKIKIYISMIKEIYDFYNGKCCRQETRDAQRCGFMKNGCEKKEWKKAKSLVYVLHKIWWESAFLKSVDET